MRKEILQLNEKETSIEAAGNKITSIRNKNITKSSARFFSEGKIYSASFVGEIDEKLLLDNAIKNKESAIEYKYPLHSLNSVSKEIFLEDKNIKDLLPEYQKALIEITNKFPDFIFSGKANIKRVSKKLKFLEESDLENSYDACEWYFVYKHKSSPSIIDGFFGSGDIGTFDVQTEVNNYSKFLEAFSNEVPLEAGKYPVIFVDSSQLFSKILESSKADNYNKGIGLFRNKLNQKILNENFTLLDVSYDTSIGATALFDADGHQRPNPKLPIIKNGTFNSLVTDSRNAQKYSLEPTGNTQRSFDSSSVLGFNTITVEAGQRTVEQILSDIPKCLIIEMAAGGDFTDLGDYSTPVQNGFLMENGKVTGKLPQITLTSSVEKMFGSDLVEIASKPFSGISKCPAVISNMDVLIN